MLSIKPTIHLYQPTANIYYKNSYFFNKKLLANSYNHSSTLIPNKSFFSSRATRQQLEVIPNLPIIDLLERAVKEKEILPDLSNTALVGTQRMLKTTGSLLVGLHELGIPYENMYFTRKGYTSSAVVEKELKKRKIHLLPSKIPSNLDYYHETFSKSIQHLWTYFQKDIKAKKINRLIILDEDGYCLRMMPRDIMFEYPIAGIEQSLNYQSTRFLFPLIQVASSIYKYIEVQSTIKYILNKIINSSKLLNIKPNLTIGVLSNSYLGAELVKSFFLSRGYRVLSYDGDTNFFSKIPAAEDNFIRVTHPAQLIANANLVFGYSGKDTLKDIDIRQFVENDIVFINCSSSEQEFKTPLKTIIDGLSLNPLSNIRCRSKSGHNITFFYGGYPVNLDKKHPSIEPDNDVQITTGLLFAACIQGIISANSPVADSGKTINGCIRYMLNPYAQQLVLQECLPQINTNAAYDKELLEYFNNIEWIKNNSGGTFNSLDPLNGIFLELKQSIHQATYDPQISLLK